MFNVYIWCYYMYLMRHSFRLNGISKDESASVVIMNLAITRVIALRCC